jgi:hypothetical protein
LFIEKLHMKISIIKCYRYPDSQAAEAKDTTSMGLRRRVAKIK